MTAADNVNYYTCLPPQGPGAGLVAAVMIAIVPGYISRSVAGSYDNEGSAPSEEFLHVLIF